MHDGLGYEVPDALVDNSHVGVHQVTDGFHFTLKLRVHGKVIWGAGGVTLHLQRKKGDLSSDGDKDVHEKIGQYIKNLGELNESGYLIQDDFFLWSNSSALFWKRTYLCFFFKIPLQNIQYSYFRTKETVHLLAK